MRRRLQGQLLNYLQSLARNLKKGAIKLRGPSHHCKSFPAVSACRAGPIVIRALHFQRIYTLASQPIDGSYFSLLRGILPLPWLPLRSWSGVGWEEGLGVDGGESYQLLTYWWMGECGQGKSVYRKINKQMKFEFLNKVLAQGQSIYEAAEQIGIHYSTAKTIIFFHKHNHKSYRSFKLEDTAPAAVGLRAAYRESAEEEAAAQRVRIISNSHFLKWQPRKELKAGNIALTYLRNSRVADAKTHPIRKPSKKSSSGRSGRQGRGSERDELFSESSASQSSDSSYVYNK